MKKKKIEYLEVNIFCIKDSRTIDKITVFCVEENKHATHYFWQWIKNIKGRGKKI